MKILQINAVYGHGSTGTIVRDIEYLCEDNGIECYVASPDPEVKKAKHGGYVIGETLDHKFHAFLSRVNGKQAYYSHWPTYKLCKYIDTLQPDIVHLHNMHSNFIQLNMLLNHLAECDIKTIVTLHDCWFYTGGCFHYANAGCYKWLVKCGNCPKKKLDTPAYFSDCSAQILADRKKYLLAIPRLVVTGVSEWISREAKCTFLKNIEIVTIRNGVDLNIFKPTPSDIRIRLGLVGKRVILGPASKWLSIVNKDVLKQFTNLMQPDERLLLFGLDVQDTSNLPTNVITYGYTKNRTEMAQLYTLADVFVNCSREDSLSLINVEAQACGTPVVTFDQTGPKETVDGIISFYVPVGDSKALYDKSRFVLDSLSEEVKIEAQQFVRKNYEINENYYRYLVLYKTVKL